MTENMLKEKRLFIFLFLWIVSVAGSLKPAHAQNNVTVRVQVLNRDKDKELLPFSLTRPLVINDFKGRPKQSSPGAAATFSGIKMTISAKEENGKTTVIVTLFPYFKIQESWMKKTGKNARVLAHEQIHFDLTAIQTCRLANAIEKASFAGDWHNHLLKLREKYMKELKQMQDQYDKDTHHGTLTEQQKAYSQFVADQMEQQNCW